MICTTCNNDVHPQPYRISAGSCLKCGVEIRGFKGHDERYQCHACGNIDRAVVSAKWIHKCPAENCGARMPSPGEVVDATPAEPEHVEQAVAETEPTAPRAVRPIVRAAPRNEPIDPVAQCKERLAFVRARIAELRQYEKEERRLSKMLAVLDDEDMAAE